MIKGLIFDLDGVLLSTDKFHYLAWKAISDAENIPFDEEINNKLKGVSRSESLEIILKNTTKVYSQEEKNILLEKKNNLYLSYLEELNEKYVDEDVINTLKTLKDKGYLLGVGSSSKNTKFILEKVNLINYFDAIADGTMITKSKPDPEVFLLAKDMLKLEVEECLVVEDAYSGIDAARSGGFDAIGINDAAKYEKTNYSINKLSDILEILNINNNHSIEIKHLKKVYQDGTNAVKDFSLNIDDGEFVVFVGPSGCGKSTVLRMIAGLEEISGGELFIDGKLVNDAEPIARNISMVFQNYALYPHLTVLENITFPLKMEKIPFKKWFDFKHRKQRNKDIKEKGLEIAKKLGLSEYINRKPMNLSGGQRQRVALGRSMIRNPKAFLLDEPLSNLDAKMRTQMRSEISRLHNELKTIFIYVTHDQIEAMTMGSKIVVMKDGYIQQIGTPSEIFLHPINKFVASFIGSPQMNFFNVVLKEKENKLFAILNDEYTFELDEKYNTLINKEYINKEVIMGVRPKEIVPGSGKNTIKGTINLSEQLGDEAILYVNINGIEDEIISSLKTYSNFNVGEQIEFALNLENTCFFDKESEMSIINEKI